jgi:hypothetical protein
MNPHAIPSRMTIAQNLEQLLGKTAALSGAIGDGTSFMNDGSPQDAIGGILEQHGFERYGNEIMYNGATGEQMEAAIFIGPVYGMRLKHMVEDKWQARGKGRREVRTHQPTGGRGAQGGLKIGEMDRDSIIAHGGMAFVKESFMERSDGDTMNICVSCGTMPIYNPRMGISICPLCDGPVRYAGETASNLELLPPMGKPKSKIVQVEIPYSTKLLTQEQESFLNLSMRYITTKDIARLRQLELTGTVKEEFKVLEPMIYKEARVAAMREQVEPAVISVAQLQSTGVALEQMAVGLDVIQEEQEESNPEEVIAAAQDPSMANPVIMPQNASLGPQAASLQPQVASLGPQVASLGPQASIGMSAQSALEAPSSIPMNMGMPQAASLQPHANMMSPQMGGMFMPDVEVRHIPISLGVGMDGTVNGPRVPGIGGGVIAIDTSERKMAEEFGFGGGMMMPRPPRRSGGFRQMGGVGFGGGNGFGAPPMGPATPRYSPAQGGGGSATTFTVNKME